MLVSGNEYEGVLIGFSISVLLSTHLKRLEKLGKTNSQWQL